MVITQEDRQVAAHLYLPTELMVAAGVVVEVLQMSAVLEMMEGTEVSQAVEVEAEVLPLVPTLQVMGATVVAAVSV